MIQAPPVVEYIAPAPAVIQTPTPVEEYLAPAPSVVQAPTPVVECLAPVPAVFQAPTPVVESIAQCHAPVFPLSPDASDTSSPEDMYTSSWVLLPVPIKTCSSKVSAEAVGQTCETPTVMHGRGLPAVSRDMGVGFASGFVRRPLVRGMLGGSGGVHSSSVRYVQHACLLVVWLVVRPCGLRHLGQVSWWRHFVNWQREGRDEYEWHGFWKGCWSQGGCEVCAGGSRDGHS